MRALGARIIGVVCLVTIAGCTTNKSIAPVTFSTKATLEMAVGTINDSQGTLGIGGTAVNVVTSFRNQFGNSAYENPGQYTLTGPLGAIVPIAVNNFGATCDELFSYGDFPGCEIDSLGDFVWGVPPTYNPPDAVGGYALGFIATAAAPAPGNYTISTSVPVNGQMIKYSASATLPASPLVLPNATGVINFTTDTLGGGTFTIGNPLRPRTHARAGRRGVTNPVTEYLILVSNPNVGIVAAIETTTTTATITGTGGGGTCTPIPCGSNSAYVIDADYPLVEAGPPANTQTAPTLTGTNGTADISVSGTFPITE